MESIIDYQNTNEDWVIDTDPGVDDAFAITLAINYIKENLKLISIQSGNVGINQCTINAKKLCVLNKTKVNISQGGSLTLSCLSLRTFSGIHGEDGFFDLEDFNGLQQKYDNTDDETFISGVNNKFLQRHSAIEIVELAQSYENSGRKLNIMAIGPLTNLALAYMIDSSIVDRFNKVILMGGAYTALGNIRPCGEFNFASDNIACKLVLDKFKRVTIYGWEPSTKHLVLPENMIKADKSNLKNNFLMQCVEKKMNGWQGGIYADYGAAVAAFYPSSITKSLMLYADISTDSAERNNSLFMVSEKNIFNNKKKEKVEIIEEMDMNIFHGLFNKILKS